MSDHSPVVVFSAGEASGDQHAAHVFEALKQRLPSVRGLGMGASRMQQAGIELAYDSSGIGVIGLVEVLKHYAEIRRALKIMQALLLKQRPDLLVCVDYKEFNLKLAKFAKAHGIKVLFYVSPQVWAWRPGRVTTYGRAIDMMAVIFPFETAYYDAKQVPVRYVGHPSVDKVKPLRSRAEDQLLYGLNSDHAVVGILPGSRNNEIKRMLPVMLQAAEALHQQRPELQFLLPQADSISDAVLETFMQECRLPIKVIKQQAYDVIQCCDAIMTTSGTASLEIALLGIPMVIAYRLSTLTYWLGRLLVNIKFIGLPNIIAGRGIVRELIQDELTAKNLSEEILRLLQDGHHREACLAGLQEVKTQLGQGGGTQKMAALIVEMLNPQ
ncbi:MAG: lipid-A-disaccharide synthase [Methylococcaceae bacterium]|nr:lipid-A-disaccharide synthase [Methylococcaceae bacterium]